MPHTHPHTHPHIHTHTYTNTHRIMIAKKKNTMNADIALPHLSHTRKSFEIDID